MTDTAMVIRMQEYIANDYVDNRSIEIEQMRIPLPKVTVMCFFELKYACKLCNLLIMREQLILVPLRGMLYIVMLFIELCTER